MSHTHPSVGSSATALASQTGSTGKRQKSLGVVPGDRPPRYLRPSEAAEYLSVGLSTLYRLIGRREIKVASIAGVRLIRTSDLDALVEANLR
jgi:excisionase family DNA binding protein